MEFHYGVVLRARCHIGAWRMHPGRTVNRGLSRAALLNFCFICIHQSSLAHSLFFYRQLFLGQGAFLHFICHRNILEPKQTADMLLMYSIESPSPLCCNAFDDALKRIVAKNVKIAIFFLDRWKD